MAQAWRHRLDGTAIDGTGTMAQARWWVHISNRSIQLTSSINIGVSASTEWRDIHPFCYKRVTHQLNLPQPTRLMSCLKCLSCEASCQILSISDCKLQNKKCKGFPLFMGSDMGISLGYRAWAGLITKTDASCHRNLLPIPRWKLQNKNCKGFPLRRDHTWASYHFGVRASSQNINQINPQPQDPKSCCQNSLNSNCKPQNENRKGFPIRRGQTQAYHLNGGLGLGLDLHY